jgi:hypothetical protein
MTVSIQTPFPETYTSPFGYAPAATLAYGFRILADADIVVTVTNHDTLAVTTLSLGSDYTVTGADASNGGNVVLITPVAADDIVTISRNTPRTQLVDLTEHGIISSEVLEKYMDKNTMICQELAITGASTAYVDAADGLRLLKAGGAMTGAIAMGTSKITGMGQPADPQDAATKKYTDDQDALRLSLASGGTVAGTITMNGGAIAMGNAKITGLATPTADTDASTKKYVDDRDALRLSLASGGTVAGTITMNGGAIAMGNAKITGLATPTADTDASTKKYVDDRDALYLPLASGGTVHGTITMHTDATIAMGANKITGLGNPTAAQDAVTKTSVDRRTVSAYTAGNISTNNSTYTEAQHVHIEVVEGESVALSFNVNIDISSMGLGDNASLALQITCGGTEVVAIPGWFTIAGADASHVTNQGFIYKHTPAAGGTLAYAINLMQDGSGILTWVINKAGLIATVTL